MTRATVGMGLCVALIVLSSAPVARAQSDPYNPYHDDRDPFDKRFSLEGHFALTGSPVGILGAMVHYAPIRFLSVGGGVGLGASPQQASPQLAASIRALGPLGPKWALMFEVGPSFGKYVDRGRISSSDPPVEWDPAYWVNALVGFERRWPGGFFMRPYGGVSVGLNPGGCRDVATADPCSRQKALIVLGLGLGANL